ncbi:MAG: porin family protein [Beijerinckiaceae bacterium]|nr:porin family protein [Beijerinckiaceae bacterium]
MKNFLLASSVLAMSAFTATAADLPMRAPAVAPAPVFVGVNWTGFYAGVQMGWNQQRDKYASSDSEWVVDEWIAGPVTGVANLSKNSFVGGVHAGYNYQVGSLVFGLEADIEGVAGKNSYSVFEADDATYLYTETWGASSRLNWQASLRARMGFAVDRALIYVTGGLAFADVETNYSNTITNIATPLVSVSGSRSFSDVKTGYTVGVGVQYALTSALSLRAEYRYTDLGTLTDSNVPWLVGTTNPADAPSYTTTERHRLTSNSVRVGLSYAFGGTSASAPVVARY